MTLDAGVASVIVATIAAVASLISAHMTRKQGQKVNETHKQVTVNHHSSKEPTVLDRIDDVKQLVLQQGQVLNAHIAHSNQMDQRLFEVEGKVHRPD